MGRPGRTRGGGGGRSTSAGSRPEGQARSGGGVPRTSLTFKILKRRANQSVKVVCGRMCGPRDVAIDSPEVTTAEGESTGQDRSSAAGIFVLTVEHVHGGGGVLLFVIVIIFALVLAWCCARKCWCSWKRARLGQKRLQRRERGFRGHQDS